MLPFTTTYSAQEDAYQALSRVDRQSNKQQTAATTTTSSPMAGSSSHATPAAAAGSICIPLQTARVYLLHDDTAKGRLSSQLRTKKRNAGDMVDKDHFLRLEDKAVAVEVSPRIGLVLGDLSHVYSSLG